MRSKVLGVALLCGALATAGVPTWAQDGGDEAAATPEMTQIPVTTRSGRPDLYLDMPYVLGGFEPEIVMTRGADHFADLAPDDPTRQELEELLLAVGAGAADLVSGYALVSQEDFFSFVVAIRVDGVTPGSLLPAYLPILLDDLQDPRVVTGTLGGKDVTIVTSIGEQDEYVELYVYDEGDTIWMVQGPRDVADVALDNLPDPLPRSAPET